jgi:hypothetical protein
MIYLRKVEIHILYFFSKLYREKFNLYSMIRQKMQPYKFGFTHCYISLGKEIRFHILSKCKICYHLSTSTDKLKDKNRRMETSFLLKEQSKFLSLFHTHTHTHTHTNRGKHKCSRISSVAFQQKLSATALINKIYRFLIFYFFS